MAAEFGIVVEAGVVVVAEQALVLRQRSWVQEQVRSTT